MDQSHKHKVEKKGRKEGRKEIRKELDKEYILYGSIYVCNILYVPFMVPYV